MSHGDARELDRPPAASIAGDSDHRLWFVMQTKSRQEKALASALAAMGIDHYLPLIDRTRYHGRRKCRVELPLFPGYLFLRGTHDQAYQADRTKRVARLIEVTDQDALEHELAQIRSALERGAALEPMPRLARGARVEVQAGPFRGIRGVVEQLGQGDRLVLNVEALGQGASLEIDADLIEVAN